MAGDLHVECQPGWGQTVGQQRNFATRDELVQIKKRAVFALSAAEKGKCLC